MKRFLALCLSLCLALALAAPICAAEPEMLPDGSIINGFDLIEKGEVVMNGTVTVTGNNFSSIRSLSIQLNGTMYLVHDVGPGRAYLGADNLTIRGNPGRQGVITGGSIGCSGTMHLRDVQVTQVDMSTLAPVVLDNDAVLTLSGQVTVTGNKKEGAPAISTCKKARRSWWTGWTLLPASA